MRKGCYSPALFWAILPGSFTLRVAFSISVGTESLRDAIIGVITRHPMREDELIETLQHLSLGDVSATLSELEMSGKAQVVERLGIRFWSASAAYYPSWESK